LLTAFIRNDDFYTIFLSVGRLESYIILLRCYNVWNIDNTRCAFVFYRGYRLEENATHGVMVLYAEGTLRGRQHPHGLQIFAETVHTNNDCRQYIVLYVGIQKISSTSLCAYFLSVVCCSCIRVYSMPIALSSWYLLLFEIFIATTAAGANINVLKYLFDGCGSIIIILRDYGV